MDYSKLSDTEVAAKVLIAQGYKLIDDGYGYSIYISDSGRKDIGPKSSKQFLFDPCNKAADAWPIILENEISINYCQAEGEWLAHADGLMKEGCWCWDVEPSPFFLDINPLRAAMIVFLMMQESE